MIKNKAFTFIIIVKICYLFITCIISAANVDSINQTLNKVKEFLQKKEYNQAISLLNKSIKNTPNAYQLWIALGYVYESKGEYKKALEAFKQAQTLKVGLSDISAKITNLEKLIKSKETIIQTNSQIDDLKIHDEKLKNLYLTALNEKKVGNFEKAFSLFLECLDKDSNFLLDPDQIIPMAINYYEKLSKKGNLDAQYMLACYKFYFSDVDAAINLIQEFLSNTKSKDSQHYDNAKIRLVRWQEFKQKLIQEQEITKQFEQQQQQEKQEKLSKLKTKISESKSSSQSNVENIVDNENTDNNKESSDSFDLKPIPEYQYVDIDEKELLEKVEAYRKTHPSKAIQAATALVNKKPSPQNYLILGDLYLEKNSNDWLDIAITYYQKILAEFPNSPEAKIAAKKILSFQPSTEQRIKEVYEYFQNVGTNHLK